MSNSLFTKLMLKIVLPFITGMLIGYALISLFVATAHGEQRMTPMLSDMHLKPTPRQTKTSEQVHLNSNNTVTFRGVVKK